MRLIFETSVFLSRVGAILGIVLLAASPCRVEAATGLRALDEPAFMVKAPNKVVLIAIARAGKRLVAVGEHGVITYSDDDGRNWMQSAVPVNVTLTAVAFANPLQGWAAGHYGVILHTSDGGLTWRVQLTGLQVIELMQAAAARAVIETNNSMAAQRAVRRANYFAVAGPDKPFLTIWIQDASHIMIFGAYRMAVKTEDGGKTWADLSLHVGDPLSHHLYDVTVIGQNIYIAAETGLIFRSTDGGANFVEVTQPAQATMFGVVNTGDGGALVFGVAGRAFRASDEGAAWQQVVFGTGANLVAATTLSSGSIVVIGQDGFLYLSTDHARSFRQLPEIQPMALFGLTQAANGDVAVVGNFGVIMVPKKDLS